MGLNGGQGAGQRAGSPGSDACCMRTLTGPAAPVQLQAMPCRINTIALAVATSLVLASALRAQEPAAELPAEPPEEEEEVEAGDRWGAEIGFALSTAGGNEDLTVLTSELGLTHLETARYELTFGGRVRYGRSEGTEVARNLRGTVNAEFWPGAPWSPFITATAEHDPFRRLDLRWNSGSGIKRTFWRQGWSEVSLSGAILYAFERVESELALPEVTHMARWSWRARVRHRLQEGTRVEQVVFFQPAWGRIGDYLLEAHSSGRVALSESLALTTSLLYQRDSLPPADVSPDDWSITIGLSMATGW